MQQIKVHSKVKRYSSHSNLPHPQATQLVKGRLVAEDKRKVADSDKATYAQGILNQILSCNAIIELSFPIHR